MSAAIYLEFLARTEPAHDEILDPLEQRLLGHLAARWHKGERVAVVQAMNMSHGASTTTVHRRLKDLKKKGMITLQMDEADNRVKYIEPSAAALAYFERMGALMLAIAGPSEQVTERKTKPPVMSARHGKTRRGAASLRA